MHEYSYQTQGYPNRELSLIDSLVIHWGGPNADSTPEQVDNYHINNNGWYGMGYHALCMKSGLVYHTQPLEAVSYHCGAGSPPKPADAPDYVTSGIGWNNWHTVGILVNCGYATRRDADGSVVRTVDVLPTAAQMVSLRWYANVWLPEALGRPVAVLSHNEISQGGTECPGAWLRQEIAAGRI